MGQNYPRLNVTEFGRYLFKSGDLDPVYIALRYARMVVPCHGDWTARWLIAYWCFYHSGFASFAAEFDKDFWRVLLLAAENVTQTPFGQRWPRSAERRHFRGPKAVSAIAVLMKRYGKRPAGMIDFLMDGPMTVAGIMERAKTHPMFGDWIAFKMADMIDAVLEERVDQSDVHAFLYDTPRQSIQTTYPGYGKHPVFFNSDPVFVEAMNWLRGELKDCTIPHKPGERPDWFSIETVWCKHLSHLHGHYPLGKDIIELHEGVKPWVPLSAVALAFREGLPREYEKEASGGLW